MKNTATQRSGAGTTPSWSRFFPFLSRLLVWALLFGIIYLLRSFFLMVFLTFVFAFIHTSAAAHLERFIKPRIVRVLIVAVLIVASLSAGFVFIVPQAVSQAKVFMGREASYISRVDCELLALSAEYPVLDEIIPDLKRFRKSLNERTPSVSPTSGIIQQFLNINLNGEGRTEEDTLLNLKELRRLSANVAGIISSFLLAILFSFLIVLDLTNLSRMVRDLEHTRLGFIYVEVADTIRDFSLVLGKALEAQFFIAVINSVLTAIGIYILGLGESVAFLSVIVFLCSFVPVLGVFISSVPICLLALQDSGLQGVLLSIALITVIHLIEGYILNPNIYGAHLRINPVLVLIILTISGRLFHIWGLILGVPVCTYIFGYAIRYTGKSGSRSPRGRPS